MRESGLIIKDQINVFAKVAYFNYYFFATFFTLAKIFILKFSWSCKFFVSQFSLFLIFFQITSSLKCIANCKVWYDNSNHVIVEKECYVWQEIQL